MNAQELHDLVAAELGPGAGFCVELEIWRDSPEVWEIYLEEPGIFYRGVTPQEAFSVFMADRPKPAAPEEPQTPGVPPG
jgi:hypothetical protein